MNAPALTNADVSLSGAQVPGTQSDTPKYPPKEPTELDCFVLHRTRKPLGLQTAS